MSPPRDAVPGCRPKCGRKHTPEYKAWVEMRRRCRAAHRAGGKHYHLRGIRVCERWEQSFDNFLADMGPKPGVGRRCSLDRIDNDKGYEPGNCRWASTAIQNANRTSFCVYYTIGGVTKCLAEWVREYGADRCVVMAALGRGLPIEQALVAPRVGRKTYTIGGESKTLPEWCQVYGVKYQTAYTRIVRKGLDILQALTKGGGRGA